MVVSGYRSGTLVGLVRLELVGLGGWNPSRLDQYGCDHLDLEFTRWRVESESVGTEYLKWNEVPEMEWST